MKTGLSQKAINHAPPRQTIQYVQPQVQNINLIQRTNYQQTPSLSTQYAGPQTPFVSNERPHLIETEHSNYNNPSDDCGTITIATSLIKGGQKYRKGEWPWLVGMFYQNDFFCGGSISNTNKICT